GSVGAAAASLCGRTGHFAQRLLAYAEQVPGRAEAWTSRRSATGRAGAGGCALCGSRTPTVTHGGRLGKRSSTLKSPRFLSTPPGPPWRGRAAVEGSVHGHRV